MENLITNFKDIGHRMSYFNAAESDWSAETFERNKCRDAFILAGMALVEVGINPDEYTGEMLVSKSDYTNTAIKRDNEENKNV